MFGEFALFGGLRAIKGFTGGNVRQNRLQSTLVLVIVFGLMLGACLGQMEAVKENVKPAKSLQKLTFEKIMRGVSSRGRFLVYFSKTELDTDTLQKLTSLQQHVNSKVEDITVGYYTCDGDSVFNCTSPDAHFPRLKFYDSKKELEVNITPENFLQQATKLKNLAVPRINIVKEKEIEAIFKDGPGYYLWLNPEHPTDGEHPDELKPFFSKPSQKMVKYTFSTDEVDSMISFAEIESLPLVIDLNPNNIGDAFAGAVKTYMVLFVDSIENQKHNVEVLSAVSKHNREHDLFYQRINFIVYRMGSDPELEAPFGVVQPGSVFLTSFVSNEFLKFKPLEDTQTHTVEGLQKFIEDFREKRLDRFYLSEPDHDLETTLPDSRVLRVTANQFKQRIVTSPESYLVLFCNDSEVCRTAHTLFKFVDKYNKHPDTLKFAYVNSDKNDVKGINLDRYPTILFYGANSKGKPKIYDLEVKAPVLMGWLNTYIQGADFEMVEGSAFFRFFWETLTLEEKDLFIKAVFVDQTEVEDVPRSLAIEIINEWEVSVGRTKSVDTKKTENTLVNQDQTDL